MQVTSATPVIRVHNNGHTTAKNVIPEEKRVYYVPSSLGISGKLRKYALPLALLANLGIGVNAARQEFRIRDTEKALAGSLNIDTVPNLVDKVGPSTVSIFGEIQNGQERGEVYGSGVIMKDKAGDLCIITCNHVIENNALTDEKGKKYLKINFYGHPDETFAKAEVVSADKDVDLAVLKFMPDQNIPDSISPLKNFKDPKTIKRGELVAIIGTSIFIKDSATLGIISNKLSTPEINLIQTDAAMNPGNSGGVLVDMKGNMVGVNSAKFLNADNISFSISMDTVSKFLKKQGIGIPGLTDQSIKAEP